jgi:hypothetical protein
VAQKDSGSGYDCIASGKEGTFKLKPSETAYFFMNDILNGYHDNEGNIEVRLSMTLE